MQDTAGVSPREARGGSVIDGLLRGAPGGPPGDLVLLMNVSALATRGPPGGPRGAPAAGFLPGGPFFFPTPFFIIRG